MPPQLAKFKGAALNFLFPQKCVGCGQEGKLICVSCQQSLSRVIPPVCPKCGRSQASGVVCPACVSWQNNIDGIRSPFKFDGVMREAIHNLKYKNLRALASPLASFLVDYFKRNPLPAQVLVPVPLHRKRLRERGYNQSWLLAREMGKLLDLPVINDCLARINFALPQARTQSVEERRHNVKGAFSCLKSGLEDKEVLLIDDVSTSGATLDSCAFTVKSAGAKTVWGLVLAREI